MTLEDLGYNEALEHFKQVNNLDAFETGRVVLEHKERYIVKTNNGEFESELLGNIRFSAESRYDLPAVGDWVAVSPYDEGKALIHKLYPRHSIIERKAAGKTSKIQIIATNVDYGLIVQSVDRDFSINRLERYLTICNASKVNPFIILSKIDLIDDAELVTILQELKERIHHVPIFTVSNQTKGFESLKPIIEKGKTYCLLGSSGVGKSTILNNLSGEESMKTGIISDSIQRGKHTTSHRELIILENGGIIIDNPGMREVGITNKTGGLESTFESILAYSDQCRFKDCTHMHESGCAVIQAVSNDELDEDAYNNFVKMEKEKNHFESDLVSRKKKDKDLGKLIKSFKKQRKNNKF